ncbi:UDP-glucuronosyltransferase 2C1-like [Heptranchias perlo]|uniref:UDP-glucuronosyltransferase 2C1-like n=1 Tax=Heptranchias perlo TaxID=212740 RepID=UPI00355A8F60
MKPLLLELVERKHEVTVLRSSNSRSVEETSHHFTIETVHIPAGKTLTEGEIRDLIFNSVDTEDSFLSSISAVWGLFTLFSKTNAVTIPAIKAMFEDPALLGRLKGADFDLVLADAYNARGVMLAHFLDLPIVVFGKWMITGDLHFTIAPSPLSYIPVLNSRLTDRMVFLDRLKNVFIYGLSDFMSNFYIYPAYNKLCQLYLKSDITIKELYQKADIFLMKVDFTFEFPRPTMPNVVYIGCFKCSPGKPLSPDLQQFMDSSGEDGVVIFSLGSVVGFLPPALAIEVAAGLAQLPQKVIWRYVGEVPSTLGNNTKIMNWLPQTDLLSHPKTKVFITHGGENGIYEAIYHGVPMVGIPVFGDQYDNLLRLKARGVVVMLDLAHLKREILFQAVKTVTENPSYRENVKHLSALQRDVPLNPKELAVFWIEYTIRHRGAAHLRAVGSELPFFQYYLLDVIVFIIASVCVLLKSVIVLFTCTTFLSFMLSANFEIMPCMPKSR